MKEEFNEKFLGGDEDSEYNNGFGNSKMMDTGNNEDLQLLKVRELLFFKRKI